MHFVFNQFIIVENENLFDEFGTVTNLQKTKKSGRWQILFSSTVCGSLSNLIHLENTRSLRGAAFLFVLMISRAESCTQTQETHQYYTP